MAAMVNAYHVIQQVYLTNAAA